MGSDEGEKVTGSNLAVQVPDTKTKCRGSLAGQVRLDPFISNLL